MRREKGSAEIHWADIAELNEGLLAGLLLRQPVIDSCGEEIYLHWLEVRRSLSAAVSAGGLRPTHLRCFRPADKPENGGF